MKRGGRSGIVICGCRKKKKHNIYRLLSSLLKNYTRLVYCSRKRLLKNVIVNCGSIVRKVERNGIGVVCGSVWLCVGVCGCVWECVVVCGSVWLCLVAYGGGNVLVWTSVWR